MDVEREPVEWDFDSILDTLAELSRNAALSLTKLSAAFEQTNLYNVFAPQEPIILHFSEEDKEPVRRPRSHGPVIRGGPFAKHGKKFRR